MPSDMQVEKDKFVGFTYKITTPDGEVIEQAELPTATIFRRHNRLYDKIEAAMMGCGVGDNVSVDLEPEDCPWGLVDSNLTFTDTLDNVPPEYRRVGAEVQFQNDNKDLKTFHVVEISDNMITFDGNHPFAGQGLTFYVDIVEIRKATGEELVEGFPQSAEGLAGMHEMS